MPPESPAISHRRIFTVTIERLCIHAADSDALRDLAEVDVIAGSGIVGDRYFSRADEPGQNITFVEAEAIEAFLAAHGRPVDLLVTRRNVVTRGVRLNDLVGRTFTVGGLRFRGVELCEPCLGLGQALASPELRPADVVRAFVHRGGLRADALSSGALKCGDAFGGDENERLAALNPPVAARSA